MTNQPLTLDQLKQKLTELQMEGDKEEAHTEADKALLSHINDSEVTDLFRSIGKWYS